MTALRDDLMQDALVHFEVSRFYSNECELLDANDLDGWLELLAPDIRYRMPVRTTRYGAGTNEFSSTSFIFNDTLFGLRMRAARLHTRFAWAEDPSSRNRHFVSNIVVGSADEQELAVRSNVLLYRSRLNEPRSELLTGQRRDVLRRTDAGLRLVLREIYIDQATLEVSAITTFV